MYRRTLFKLLRGCSPLLLVPILHNAHCLWWSKKKENMLQERMHIGVEVSNKPCEDRHAQKQLTSIKGYAAAVYDGHGGWQVSHLCSKRLLEELDRCIQANLPLIKNEEELIKKSLNDAFKVVEEDFLQVARQGYKFGFGRMGRAGSCALVCVVVNNKVYAANAGDSLGLIIDQDRQNRMSYVELNKQLNANKQEERQRLKKLFPGEDDVVVCKKDNRSCYVKGRLQPTRSLGDLRLKHKEFNNPDNYSHDHDYQKPLEKFTGPYITWEPEIQVFNLKPTHKCLILASDGLWDELQRQEVAELFRNSPLAKMPQLLITRTLQKAAQDANLTIPKIRAIPAGKKRKIHDDITVVVVDLQKQYKQ